MAFKHEEIIECACLAKSAYTSIQGSEAFSDPSTDCQCYVVKSPQTRIAYVVFRGTSSVQDCMDDCQVELVEFVGKSAARVHAGFLAQVQSVAADVGHSLSDWKGEVRCTGHSLGSGDAQIMACMLAHGWAGDHRRPVSFVGFGTPRVGDKPYKKLFESLVTRSMRVKNGRDPVTGVPGAPYVHAGEEMHIGRADPHPELPSLDNIADHDMTTGYLANLTKDDASAKGEGAAEYILMFLANRLATAAKGLKK